MESVPLGVDRMHDAHIVFYDGHCALCHRSVRWLLDHDPYQRLLFAPLQGATAARLREEQVPLPENLESVALVVRRQGETKVFVRSQALLELCNLIEFHPWWVRLLGYVPTIIADLAYRLTARLRYALFGPAKVCPWRTVTESHRFLD